MNIVVVVVVTAFCLRSRSSLVGSDGSAVSVTTVHGTAFALRNSVPSVVYR